MAWSQEPAPVDWAYILMKQPWAVGALCRTRAHRHPEGDRAHAEANVFEEHFSNIWHRSPEVNIVCDVVQISFHTSD